MQFIFFFGRNPQLSLAELVSTPEFNQKEFSVQPLWPNAALVEAAESFNTEKLLKRLGGTTKISKILFELEKPLSDSLAAGLNERFYNQLSEKFFFSLSPLGKINPNELSTVLKQLKEGFKERRLKGQIKRSNEHKEHNVEITTPSEILSWKLLENGTDWTLAKTADKLFFAKTVCVSNPGDWKFRDEKRPAKDNKEIISIRLAKILINLAGLKENETILDPFCGYGTVLQEALLNGLNGIGIEKDNRKTQAAKKNIAWIQKTFSMKQQAQVFNKDASQLSGVLAKNSFQGVATEPFMGPYLIKNPAPQKASQIIAELEPLYEKLFSELARLMSVGQKVVFIFPAFEYTNGKKVTVSTKVFSNWFTSVNPIESFGSAYQSAFPFPYQNPKNLLKREIQILRKK